MASNRIIITSFVETINSLTPSLELFEKAGYDKKTAIELIKALSISLNDNNNVNNNTLFDSFMTNINLSNFNIISLFFSKPYSLDNNFIVFGSFEENALALNTKNGNIVVLNEYNNFELIHEIAANFNDFIKIVIVYTEFTVFCYLNSKISKIDKQYFYDKITNLLNNDDKYLSCHNHFLQA
jgi:hypothetical protein